MKLKYIVLATVISFILASVTAAQDSPPPKPKGPPPGGKGGPSQDSAEMQALLKSFHLSADQQAKYDAAKKTTSEQMRKIHEGKVSGTLPQDEVLKQALASHKAFNAVVKEILTPEQYAQWEPLRESDHHKIAAAHKARDEDAAKKAGDSDSKPSPPPQ
jgi:hypothetical protein